MQKFAVKMFDFLIFQRQIRGLYALGKQQLYKCTLVWVNFSEFEITVYGSCQM